MAATLRGLVAVGFLTEQDVSEHVLSTFHTRLEYGYPTPFQGRDAIVHAVDEQLRSAGIYSRGRFGAFKYEVSNQDHSFMQGVEAVGAILQGTEEVTFFRPSEANSSGSRGGKSGAAQPAAAAATAAPAKA